MYDVPRENEALWTALGNGLREAGWNVPLRLDEPDSALPAHWRCPDLVFSQTCGGPLVSSLETAVLVVARPVYDVPHCGEGTYRSVLVARRGAALSLKDARGGRLAANEPHSLSGHLTLRDYLPSGSGWLDGPLWTGSHAASAAAVARGEADLAAIDAVTWHLLTVRDPGMCAGLDIIGVTPERPSLPYITAAANRERLPLLRRELTRAVETVRHGFGFPISRLRTVLPATNEEYEAALRHLVRP